MDDGGVMTGGAAMTVLPEWLQLSPEGVTVSDYAALPEDVCRRVEIVDGAVVVLPAPTRSHQRLVRRLADVLEAGCGPELAVVTGADLQVQETPLVNRRPDIVVYDAQVPDEQVLRPADCRLVVEIMSAGFVTADRLSKPAEYAAAGIRHYWRVESGEGSTPQRVIRHVLDPPTQSYVVDGADERALSVTSPYQPAPAGGLTGQRASQRPQRHATPVGVGEFGVRPQASTER